MNKIKDWILDDILNSINKLGFCVETAEIETLHACTDNTRELIIYNPDLASLYELSEEYIHALKHHHRRNPEYDFRNPDEAEAHDLALDYLLERWCSYECPNNWLFFMEAMGTPAYLQDSIIDKLTALAGTFF
ncbi:hypothetical protein WOSG25_041370 [Weissella oryzae SG25]|uniref:Uncharacterized protein n=1 Tax=Weissella oryzae (strain DSM 25784 / JCM 18191 / LMG 30913 / SG25) TaxID=1329250 RepID=A0A069D042_WEIOS|nr:hypothetical protein [Weissella oryzae]GAK30696.1 hypothetical protein WOSG25_041370 [Weissella oryzae SG25]